MPENNCFQILPFLLPENGKRLLIVGWHKSMRGFPLKNWKEKRVLIDSAYQRTVEEQLAKISSNSNTSISANSTMHDFSPTAVLLCGVGPLGWKNSLPDGLIQFRDIPYAAIARGRTGKQWSSQLGEDTWIMEGLPSTGMRPVLWLPKYKATIPWSMFSPRGRFERSWVRFHALLRRFQFPLQRLKIIVNGSHSLLSRYIAEASPRHTGPGCFWYHTRGDCLFVFLTNPEPGSILKIPLSINARDSIKLHHQRLNEIRNHRNCTNISNLLPGDQFLVSGDFVSGVEEIIPGITAFQLLRRRRDLKRAMSEAADVLCEWQREHALRLTIDDRLFENFWERPLRPLQVVLENNGKGSIYSDCLKIMKRKTVGKSLPLVPVHGDFWLNNLIWDPKHRCINGILDWHVSRAQGLPLLDLFHLLYWRTNYFYNLHSRFTFFQTVKRNFPGLPGQILRAYCTKLDISFSQLPFLFCRYWLGEAANRIEVLQSKKEPLRALENMHRYLVAFEEELVRSASY